MELFGDAIIDFFADYEPMPEHQLLYHGTSYNSLCGLLKNQQFIPQKVKGSDALSSGEYTRQQFEGYLFFANVDWLAATYSSLASANQGDYQKGRVDVLLALEVPNARLLPDSCDSKSDTWEESLKAINACSVFGPLTFSKAYIYIIDYESQEPLYLTDSLTVESFQRAVQRYNLENSKGELNE